MPVRADVRLDALQQSESAAARDEQRVDRLPLLRTLRHRHAAGNLQTVRVVGYRRVGVTPRETRIDDVAQLGVAIAPDRMHLEVAAIVVQRGPGEPWIVQHSPYFGAAEH